MKKATLIVSAAAVLACGLGMLNAAAPPPEPPAPAAPAANVAEPDADAARVVQARLRAQLLHETIHGSLQVMHRDLFREGEPIPSASLEDVFAELENTWRVKAKWLVVNAKAMNIKNRPKTPFDHSAAKAIADGSDMFEYAADGVYQYAGRITLGNQCLKCHVPDRKTLEDRKAAVVISMPLDLGTPPAK